jgi:Flp pilus assembly protein TadG
MTLLQRLRGRRAQATVETALIIPFLTLMVLGAADFGRAFYLSLEITGASRAGMRDGIQGLGHDIGDATRSEPNTAIPNTVAAWGSMGPGQTNDCNPNTPGHYCGAANGCTAADFVPGQVACFAVAACELNASGVCTTTPTWQTRPVGAGDTLSSLWVRVVYKFAPATPLIANFGGSSGVFYLTHDAFGLELY